MLGGLETEYLERRKVWYESKADRDNMPAHYAGAVLAEQGAVARMFEEGFASLNGRATVVGLLMSIDIM